MKLWKKSMDLSDEEELSFRERFMLFLRKAVIMSFFGLVLAGIGIGIAWIIVKQSDFLIQDVAFTEGVVIIMLGLMFGMKGNPFGMGMSSWGMKNSTAINVWNLEASIRDKKSTDEDKNNRMHAVIELLFGRVTIILSGIFLIVISILFL